MGVGKCTHLVYDAYRRRLLLVVLLLRFIFFYNYRTAWLYEFTFLINTLFRCGSKWHKSWHEEKDVKIIERTKHNEINIQAINIKVVGSSRGLEADGWSLETLTSLKCFNEVTPFFNLFLSLFFFFSF